MEEKELIKEIEALKNDISTQGKEIEALKKKASKTNIATTIAATIVANNMGTGVGTDEMIDLAIESTELLIKKIK